MTKSILSASALSLFVVFAGGVIVAEVVARVAATYFDWNRSYGPYPTLRYGLITLLLWTYPYLVGRALCRRAGTTGHRRVLWVILLAIINNVLSVYLTESYGPLWYLVLITVLLNVFCLLQVLSFPSRELKSLQLKRRATLPEYWRELLMFAAWPLCVWWLQPAIRDIAGTED
jgi:hypothetical protein